MGKVTHITSRNKPFYFKLKELFKNREVLKAFVIKDFKVKYAQTTLGFLWALINPLILLVILTFVFGYIVNVDTGEVPPTLITMSGLVSWMFFSNVLQEGGISLINQQNIIKKVAFPRLVIPVSKTINAFIDFGITFLLMAILLLYFGVKPSINLLYLPFIVIHSLIIALGFSIVLSALTLRFRDFRFVIPLITRVGLYISPVAYTLSAVPEKYKIWFYINPISGNIELYRWILLGTELNLSCVVYSVFISMFIFLFSLFYFNKVDWIAADII